MSSTEKILMALLNGGADLANAGMAGVRDSLYPFTDTRESMTPTGLGQQAPANITPTQFGRPIPSAEETREYERQLASVNRQFESAQYSPTERIAYAGGEALPPTVALSPLAAGGGLAALGGELLAGPVGAMTGQAIREGGGGGLASLGGDVLASTLMAGPVGLATSLARGSRLVGAAVQVDGRTFQGATHADAIEAALESGVFKDITSATSLDELDELGDDAFTKFFDDASMSHSFEDGGFLDDAGNFHTREEAHDLFDGTRRSEDMGFDVDQGEAILPSGNLGLDIMTGAHELPDSVGTFTKAGARRSTTNDIANYFAENHPDPISVWNKGVPQASPEQLDALENSLVSEVRHAMELHPEAAGWYKENIGLTFDVLEELDPAIRQPENLAVFNALLAITSNGNRVDDNFSQAWAGYDAWRKTGEVPLTGPYAGTQGVEGGIKAYVKLVDTLGGHEPAAEWLKRTGTVRELRQSLIDDLGWTKAEAMKMGGGESVNTEVNFANIFGPKLGSFYGNLNGNFDTTTMDRWFMRTMGRVGGNQNEVIAPKRLAAMRKRVKAAAANVPVSLKKKFGFKSGMTNADLDVAVAKANKHYAEKSNRVGLTNEEQEFRKAINNLGKTSDPRIEAPRNSGHRDWIRERMAGVRARLRDQGTELNAADLQALLWYQEKELYEKFGYRSRDNVSDDYAGAAASLFERVAGRPSQRYSEGTGHVGQVGRSVEPQ